VVIAGPTSSRKWTVADLFLVRSALLNARRRCAIYVAPTRALTKERWQRLSDMLANTSLCNSIVVSTGDDVMDDWRISHGKFGIACMVYEKANALLSRSPHLLSNIGCVVVDELHMLADPERGLRLEMLIAKLLAERFRDDLTSSRFNRREVLRLVALTTDAELAEDVIRALSTFEPQPSEIRLPPLIFRSSIRPVPVRHYIVPRGSADKPIEPIHLFDVQGSQTTQIPADRRAELQVLLEQYHATLTPPEEPDRPRLLRFVSGLLKQNATGRRILVFVGSIRHAERCAAELAAQRGASRLVAEPIAGAYSDFERSLDEAGDQEMAELLKQCSRAGCFFHHRFVAINIRSQIEALIREPLHQLESSQVIFSTTTLNYGVNLAITDVVARLQFPWSTGERRTLEFLPYAAFHKLAGRAGRLG